MSAIDSTDHIHMIPSRDTPLARHKESHPMRVCLPICVLYLLTFAATSSPAADALDFSVHNRLDQARESAAVTCGVPLPKGFTASAEQLALRNADGEALPLQVVVTGTYKDGSPRWVLLDFQSDLPAGSAAAFSLVAGDKRAAPDQKLSYSIDGGVATVDTGAAVFRVPTDSFALLDSITVDGTALIGEGGGAVLEEQGGATHQGSDVTDAAFEDDGPLHAVLAIRGRFKPGGKLPLANYICRLHFYAGKSYVRVFYTLHNPQAQAHPGNVWDLGQGGSIFAEDVSLRLPLADGEWSSRAGHQDGAIDLASKIYQDSSGGEFWDSPNHVDKDMNVPTSFRGYKLYDGEREAGAGHRADGWLHARSEAGGIAVALRDFWQNFPKAFELDGDTVRMALWPREYSIPHEILGGEQKTHELLIFAHGAGTDDEAVATVMAEFHSPLYATPAPDDLIASKAFWPTAPVDRERHPKIEQTIDTAVHVHGRRQTSIMQMWEKIDEYGWRHFGDTFADNEHSPAQMAKDFPEHHFNRRQGISLYGTAYAVIYTVILEGLRRQDPEFMYMGDVLARHYADICVYHTDHDSYGHGPFTHTTHSTAALRSTHRMYPSEGKKYGIRYDSGGPNAGHTYLAGVAQHYYLTGDRVSRASFLEVADWCSESAWFTKKRYLGDKRGLGNFITTLLHAYQMTWDQKYHDALITVIEDGMPLGNGNARSLLAKALGRFLDMKTDNGEAGDEDYQFALELLLQQGDRVLEEADGWKSNQHFGAYTRHGIAVANAYRHAPEDHPRREAYLQRLKDLFAEAKERDAWPATYCTTKGWVIAFSNIGPCLAALAEADGEQ